MNELKKEYEEWDRYVDEIKSKKLDEVFYTLKEMKDDKGNIIIYQVFTAAKESKNTDGIAVCHFFNHVIQLLAINLADNPDQNKVVSAINELSDANIKDLQNRTTVKVIKGSVTEI